MTDILTRDPNDSDEFPLGIAEQRTVILRRDTTGEKTENLGQYFRADAPFMTTVRAAAGDRIGPEVPNLLPTIGILPDLGSDQPTLVYGERVIDIEGAVVHGIRVSLAGATSTLDGELEGPQKPPPPLPKPKLRRSVPVAAMVDRDPPGWRKRAFHRGKRRKAEVRRVSPWLMVAGVVAFGVAVYVGVLVAVWAVLG